MPRGAKRFVGMAYLQNMLKAHRQELAKLRRERVKAARQLLKLDQRIALLSGDGGGARASNPKSLVAMMRDAMANGKPIKVGDLVAAVQKAGYRSSSGNFRALVNQTLIKDKGFTQVSRGVYQLKK